MGVVNEASRILFSGDDEFLACSHLFKLSLHVSNIFGCEGMMVRICCCFDVRGVLLLVLQKLFGRCYTC